MSARPRLVHEGSPIVDEGDSGFAAATPWSDGARAEDSYRANTLASIVNSGSKNSASASTNSKPYKLQTRLIVGGETNEEDNDLDMMMEEDDHNQHNQHGSNFGCYRGHNDEQHGHQVQNQQCNTGHSMFPAHHKQKMQPSYEIHNGRQGFVPPNQTPHVPAPELAQPCMPPPSVAPLVVIDGANIAYNYAESLNPLQQSRRRQPDPRGIRLAIDYFFKHRCRVQAVVPISWYQLKPRPADHYHLKNRSRGDSDARMVTEEVEELRSLRQQGFLVACPPGDDDDAYALALARREEDRLLQQRGVQQDEPMDTDDDESQHLPKTVMGGYVVSNDFYQDAMRRDEKRHRNHKYPLSMRTVSLRSWLKKNRISYSFANVGTSGLKCEIQLEFIPNPRNCLIETIDVYNRLNYSA